jgi:hypothetical protein
MAKTYRTPAVAVLGTAEVMTSGLPFGPLTETPVGTFVKTTHAILDL